MGNHSFMKTTRMFLASSVLGVAGIVAVASPLTSAAAEGQAVTFTAGQVSRGKAAYGRACVDCHGETLDNGEFGGPPLRGTDFLGHWTGGSVAALFTRTKTTMPADRPGSLSDQAYTDVVAFILDANGYKAGDRELPVDAQAQALISLARD